MFHEENTEKVRTDASRCVDKRGKARSSEGNRKLGSLTREVKIRIVSKREKLNSLGNCRWWLMLFEI